MACRRASVALLLLASSSLAHAQAVLPTGGNVTLGSAAITASGNSIAVDQTSARAVVNWDSFSVGQGASVRFTQPGTQAAILNRVTGTAASTIAGAVTGNGQVFLVNPNGIAITSTGTVDIAGGFVASTLDIADRDFATGTLTFTGSGAGSVSNAGSIRVGSGGFAALLGGRVANSGTIDAPLGRIGLGSARQATLDLTGDGFLQVALPASGDDPLIEAAGRLSGARIELRAATVSDAIRNAVNVPGNLIAQGAHAEGGVVVLDGGGGGAVQISGKVAAGSDQGTGGTITASGASLTLDGASLDASGGAAGGAVTLSAATIDLAGHTALTATGGAQGGTVLVGGGLHGAGDLPQATRVTMGSDAAIDVSATRDGHGGTAVLWSRVDDPASLTRFGGTILARGAGAGDGGTVETSGRRVDVADGLVNAGTPLGKGGTWLIDPADTTITQSIANSYASTLNTGTSVLNSVTGSITWASGVSLAKTAGGDATLTLQAGNPSGNSPITLTNAAISSTSGALNLVLWTRYNSTTHEGLIAITGSTIATNGGSVWLGGGLPGGTWNGLAVGLNPATTYTANKQAIYLATSSITTVTGSISLRGQSNVGGTTTGTKNIGIWLDTGTTLSTTTGNIIVAGDVLGTYANGAGVVLGGRSASAAGNVTLSTDSGAITLTGTGTDSIGSGTGQRDALVLSALAAGDQTIVKSVSGAIALTGTATFNGNNYANGTTAGVRLESDTASGQVGVVTQSGAISITGSNTLEAKGPLADGLVLSAADAAGSIRIGYDGTHADNGAITLTADSINQVDTNAIPGSISVQTDGALKIQSLGNSFTEMRTGVSGALSFDSNWNFGTGLASFTLGKSTDTAALALSHALSVAGPIAITGGSIALSAALASTGASTGGNAISLTALSGGITGTAAATIATSGVLTLDVETAGATGTLAGMISGTGSVTKSGAGTQVLSGANGFSGALTLLGGVLRLGGAGTLGAGSYGGAIALGSGTVLEMSSSASQTLSGAISGMGALSKDTGSATLTLSGANSYTGATTVSSGLLDLAGSWNVGTGSIQLDVASGAGVTGAGTVTAGTLSLGGAGIYSLTGANQIGTLTGTAPIGALTLNHAGSLTLGSLNSTGAVRITAGADLTLASGTTVSSSAGGDALVLWAGDRFVNDAGSGALSAANGRWLVHAASPATSLFGGLDSGTTAVWGVDSPGTVGQSGNRYVFTQAPVLTLTAMDRAKTYGQSVTLGAVAGTDYALSGLSGGVAGAFLGDTVATALSGAPMLASDGAAAGAAVGSGSYAITVSPGTLGSLAGYRIAYADGVLSVGKAGLTVTATDAARTYDGTAYSGGHGVTYQGFVNGETAAVLGGMLAYGGAAQGAVNAGSYSLTASGLTSGNYDVHYAAGLLQIGLRPITVTANALFRTAGAPNPALTYVVSGDGLVPGDVLSGALATDAAASSPPGLYRIGQGTLLSGANYALTFVPGSLVVGSALFVAGQLPSFHVPADLSPPVSDTLDFSDDTRSDAEQARDQKRTSPSRPK